MKTLFNRLFGRKKAPASVPVVKAEVAADTALIRLRELHEALCRLEDGVAKNTQMKAEILSRM